MSSDETMDHSDTHPVYTSKLPAMLEPHFWDYEFEALTWKSDWDLIIGRVLTSGTWEAVTWLRSRVGDQAIREWILNHQGRGLSPQQLRFWELILGLPHHQVNIWLKAEGRKIWEKRTHP
jgi:hypothetical protein